MERIKFTFIAVVIVAAGLVSCELDNYEAPSAELSGSFIDAETGELVQQDIIRGTEVQLTEHGYDPVSHQYLNAKPGGTYQDKLLFANTYTIEPVRGNFLPVEPDSIVIEGKTVHDFVVTPYLRIIDANIVKEGSKIIATFRVQQNVSEDITRVGLYGHPNPIAGQPINTMATETPINAGVDPSQTFTLEIDLAGNTEVEEGDKYFFRVGAHANIPEAKFNYAPGVWIDI